MAHHRGGFTLLELLVVLVIIGLVSVIAIGAGALTAFQHRQSSEAARLLHAALAGARDEAILTGRPSGIRLLPDPAFPVGWVNGQVDPSQILASNRWVPIAPAPEYSEGAVTVRPGAVYSPATHNPAGLAVAVPSLVLESAPLDAAGAPLPPTSWAWNIRVGDRVQLGGAGPWYTVAGPAWIGAAGGNSELFINWGPSGAPSPLNPTGTGAVEWLILTDGRDDNGNGWTDEGFDGVDNNGDGAIDDAGEWEPEAWQGVAGAGKGLAVVPYTIRRRPSPTSAAREVALPSQVVIDLTTWATTRERSRLPVNPYTGAVDLLVNPDGSVVPATVYGTPSSVGLAGAFYHFWLAERRDLAAPAGLAAPSLPAPRGEWWLVTLFSRSGLVRSVANPPLAAPYSAIQQGTP